jgi:Holliday junction DNA helicase RuvB
LFRNLEFYGIAELIQIIKRSALILNVAVDDAGAKALAQRSRGTPRIVNRLLKRVRDYAQVKGDGRIVKKTVEAALTLEGVDGKGLTRLDRRYLKTIIDYYHGGPVGIEAIAATLQEESDTLVDVVEPYLLNIGMVIRTSSGRKASEEAYRHLGYCIQEKLF